MFRELCVGALLVAGCATDSNELVVRAEGNGLAGEYLGGGTTIRFAAFEVSRGGDVPPAIAAAFFDENGAIIAARYPGDALPDAWQTREPSERAIALLPDAIDALANADVDASLERERDGLVEMNREVAAEDDASDKAAPQGASALLSFSRNCGAREELGFIRIRNSSGYFRQATIRFWDGWGGGTYYYSIEPYSTRYPGIGTYMLSSAQASGTSLTFSVYSNYCGTEIIARSAPDDAAL
jgi:hypothetical protein